MSQTLEIRVVGMGCGGCESKVEGALGEIEGIVSVKADHATGAVEITVASNSDGSPLVDIPVLATALERIGHPME